MAVYRVQRTRDYTVMSNYHLKDMYRYFEKLETGYMDVIRDSIESRANEVCREPEELNPMVVYLHSASYATKHGEIRTGADELYSRQYHSA